MARGRPEIPKSQQKKVAKQLLERQKRAGVYEKGLVDAAKIALAGMAFPVDMVEGATQGVFTPPASYKAAKMRPRGGGIPETPPPVANPEYKGTSEHVGKQLGVDVTGPGALFPSLLSPDPFAKISAISALGKLGASKLANLGITAAMFGGLKKLEKATDAAAATKPIFTSPGKTAAADIAKETIPANKVKSQLEGRGVNKDEMEWTGFNEWISTKKGEVSKAEIEEFFQQNQIEVREVVRSEGNFVELRELKKFRADMREKHGNTETFNWPEDVQKKLLELEAKADAPASQPKFSSPSWQLPGGENYRELVLMVPPKKVPWTKENVIPISAEEAIKIKHPKGAELTLGQRDVADKADNFYWFQTPDGVVQSVSKKDYKATDFLEIGTGKSMPPESNLTQAEALEKVLTRQPKPKPRYTGGHFEENDVVAHIRFNERVDPDGNKVLFIEEIQSDWGHKGQDVGFKSPETEAAKIKLENVKMKITQINDKIRSIGLDEGALQHMAGKGPSDYKKIATLGKEKTALQQERTALQLENLDLIDKRKSPIDPLEPGPFVTDTHQWTNLALKRMIRWGSDNGFDSIGWVTGKQSADRYKVSTQVDTIYWNPKTTELVAVEKGGNRKVINEKVPENKLADYIGKEPANRLLESQLGEGEKILQQYDDGLITYDELDFMTDSHSLQGEDLDIGGEYHKLIYDQVLTAQAKKIGKKHGAKVEEGNIGRKTDIEVKEYGKQYFPEWDNVFVVWDKTLDGPKLDPITKTKYYRTKDEAIKAKEGILNEEAVKVWSMRLTDKLKNAAKDGMPYYVALPPLVIGAAAAQRTDAQRQQSKSDAQAIMAN